MLTLMVSFLGSEEHGQAFSNVIYELAQIVGASCIVHKVICWRSHGAIYNLI